MLRYGHQTERRQYSLQRCHALREYQQRTSTARALGVCVLTPLPALSFTIAVEALLPLPPVTDGWDASPNLAIRFFAASAVIALCSMNIARRVIPEVQVPQYKLALSAIVSAASYTAFLLALAARWVFPVPYMTTVTSGAFVVCIVVSILLIIGPQPFREIPDFRRKLTAFLGLQLILHTLNMFYPAYGAFYRTQHDVIQTIIVFLPLVVKILAKMLTAKIIRGVVLEDYFPEIIQLSVELLHTMFVTTCVQASTQPTQITLVIFLFDFLPLVWTYTRIWRLAGHSFSRIHIHPRVSRPPQTGLEKASVQEGDVANRQALHASENHLLIEYIECVIPVVYAIYVAVLFHLPNARYYDTMDTMKTSQRLDGFLLNVSALVALQVASVVVFSVLLSRRVLSGVSCLHQLSFVLETQRELVQCWFFAWIPFCILSTIQHGGMDFTLRFEWMRRNHTVS